MKRVVLLSFSFLFTHFLSMIHANLKEFPPVLPPPVHTLEKAHQVYGEAFAKAFEFIEMNQIPGDIAEFGVMHGFTSCKLATFVAKHPGSSQLLLFDSFEGLPAIQSTVDQNCYEVKQLKAWEKGSMAVPQNTPQVLQGFLSQILKEEQFRIHKGYFKDTLSLDLFQHKLALVHFDCDLYQSAKEVLSFLIKNELLEDGTILLFDDYNCGRANPNMGERKALAEVLQEHPNIACSLFYYYGWGGAAFIFHLLNQK